MIRERLCRLDPFDDCMTPPPNGERPGSDGNAASDALLLVDAERFAHLMEEVRPTAGAPHPLLPRTVPASASHPNALLWVQ